MAKQLQCMLPVRQLRGYVCMVAFSCLFLYILSGVYLKQPSNNIARHGRQLMSYQDADIDVCGDPELYIDGLPVSLNQSHCSSLDHISENSSSCLFVTCVESCQNDEGIINYLNFIYCQMPPNLIPLAMVILFVWLIFLFIVLGATAEEYFCPALTVMSQTLRMSQNVAGVTLLAFGNGAPDIFSAIAAINQADDQKASLAVGALFGAGIFVTTVVVGAVSITKPFTLTQRPFLRDIIFYMVAVFWTFYLLWNNYANIYHAVGFITMYLFYVLVVILGRFFYQRWKKMRNIKSIGTGDIPTAPSLPVGEELNESRTTGVFSHLPSSDIGSIQDPSVTIDNSEIVRPPSFPEPESLMTPTFVTPPVTITVHDEEGADDKNQKRRSSELTSSLPSTRSHGYGLLAPLSDRPRGGSLVMEDEYEARPAKHRRKKMRRTLSGALDITEEVGAAVGIPHLSKVWGEVHRSHSRSRSSSRLSGHPEAPGEDEQDSDSSSSSDDEIDPLIDLKVNQPPHPFLKLLLALWPFGESFKELGKVGKVYEIIKSPASFFLTLTVPVVDSNEDNHNWNKWLNVLHCVTSPMFIILIIKYRFFLIGDVFPVAAIILFFSLVLAVVVALTSKNNKPPVYHCAYAWVGFAVAVVWIYTTANEIVNLLQAFGLVISLSEGILGLTLLAWGNSIGDAVSNVTMAKQGFPRMAIGACFGGPLLNMLLGIGLGSMLKSFNTNGAFTFSLYFTQVELLASLFLMLSLSVSLVVIFCLKFRLNRPYGVVLLLIYVLFLVVAILAEANVFIINIPGVITHED